MTPTELLIGDPLRAGAVPLIYLAHPVAGDPEVNAASGVRWMAWLLRERPDAAVIAPWIDYVDVLDDGDPEQRARGMRDSIAVLGVCDELWLCGPRISDGMQRELEVARECGLRVVLALAEEVPQ